MRAKTTLHQRDLEHKERLRQKREKVEGLVALLKTWEQLGNRKEIQRVAVRLRFARQELRYMGEGPDSELEFKVNGKPNRKPTTRRSNK